MTITINNNSPRVQYIASSGQTDFAGTWRIENAADIKVYQTLLGNSPDDTTDILINPTNYTVTGVGVGNSFTVVLNVGAATGDVISILADINFSANYNFLTNQDFDPVVFNQIFSKFDRELKQLRMETRKLQPKYQNSEQVIAKDYKLPQLAANQVWKMNQTNTEIEAVDVTPTTVKVVYYGVTTGTDTYAVTIADFPGYSIDYPISINIGTTNTSAATINVNGLGAKNLVRSDGTALQADDLQADTTYIFLFHDNKYYLYGVQRATESSVGISQIATGAEVEAGTNDFKYVTPKKLRLHSGNVFFVNTGGVADVYTGAITGLTSLEQGLTVELLINTTNTGASTLDINSLGDKDLLRADGNTMQAGDLTIGLYYTFIYTGVEFKQFGIATATPAEVKAATDLFNPIVPGRAIYHPSAVKAFAHFNWTGAVVNINDSYNIASIVRIAAGRYTVTFTIPFANAFYMVDGNGDDGVTSLDVVADIPYTISTTAMNVRLLNIPAGTPADPNTFGSIFFIGKL
jgi:hypothetical protein